MNSSFLDEIKKIRTIADIGLLYSNNAYDRERYTELKAISLQLISQASGHHIEDLKEVFPVVTEYPTAKVDIRALILSEDNKILLVKESSDGKWAVPGGWADVGYTPKEVIVKECREETGLIVTPEKLLAVFDKRKHPHPPQPFYVYKMVFLCKALSTQIKKGFDVADVQYFDIYHLPPLSEDRILKSQLLFLYERVKALVPETYFD